MRVMVRSWPRGLLPAMPQVLVDLQPGDHVRAINKISRKL